MGWSAEDDVGHSDADVRRALEEVDAEASKQNAERGAAMREARLIVEEALLG